MCFQKALIGTFLKGPLESYFLVNIIALMTDTKTEIWNFSEKLIRTKGYHGFDFKDISVLLNLKNSAINCFCPTKAEFGLDILQWTLQTFQFQTSFWQKRSSLKKPDTFIDVYEVSRKKKRVGFMELIKFSYDAITKRIKSSFNESSLEIRNWLRNVLKGAIEQLN